MNLLTPANHASQLPRLAYEGDPVYPAADAEHLITFHDLLRVLRIHWRVILAAAAAAAALSMLAASLITPTYVGAALVMVDEQQRHLFNEQTDPSVLSDLPSDPSSIESQVQMLQSHALAGQVVDKLRLVDDSEFNGATPDLLDTIFGFAPRLISSFEFGKANPGGSRAGLPDAQRLREQTIGRLQAGLDVHAMGLSTVIAVNFRSASAEKAARIANAIAGTYIDNLASAKSNAAEGASKWLGDRVTQLGQQAGAADSAVQQYKAENGLIDTSNGTAMTDQQLGDLTTQLIQAQGDQAQAQAKLARVRQLVGSGHSADVTDVVVSPLIVQLREQEATLLQQKADLSSRYGPRHPAMQNIEARVHQLEQKISEEIDRIVGTASNDVAVSAARVNAIRGNMTMATSSTAVQNRARVKLAQLAANASSAHALYQSYLDRLKQMQQRASLDNPDVHLVSPAPVPLAPVSPKKSLIVGGAALVSLVLGFLAALFADRMCSGFRSAAELEAALGLTVLTTIPEVKLRRDRLNDITLEVIKKPLSLFSEAFRGLEMRLLMSKARNGGGKFNRDKVILVTSALPAEGKTSTSVSLARRLATSGYRVVIVDADQRRPKVAAAVGLRNVRFCLSDYLARRCSLEEALRGDPHSPLAVMAGSHSSNEVDLIGSPAMAALIDRLREVADFVVIDSPPLLAVNDAKSLALLADSTVFVVRWRRTPREAVLLAVKCLREIRTKFLGVALVRTDPKQYQYYTFGYTGAPKLVGYYQG